VAAYRRWRALTIGVVGGLALATAAPASAAPPASTAPPASAAPSANGLPSGVYSLELNFAELKAAKPNTRVFDVLAEGAEVLPSLDLALEAGSFTAVDRTYLVKVTDGQFNVRFVTHNGFGKPLVNAIRITQRPDKA
jgi:hypothetical protein